jgi:hypothetical protein
VVGFVGSKMVDDFALTTNHQLFSPPTFLSNFLIMKMKFAKVMIACSLILSSCGNDENMTVGDSLRKSDSVLPDLDSLLKADSIVTASYHLSKEDSIKVADSAKPKTKNPIRDFN